MAFEFIREQSSNLSSKTLVSVIWIFYIFSCPRFIMYISWDSQLAFDVVENMLICFCFAKGLLCRGVLDLEDKRKFLKTGQRNISGLRSLRDTQTSD